MGSSERLSHIDALRAIAALLVVWQHSSETFVRQSAIAVNGTVLADMAWAVDFGRIGVICFFLISGFVIPFSFPSGPSPIKTFAIRRFFRLYPAYWLSIISMVLISISLSNSSWDATTILVNATMLQQFFGVPHVLGLYWTLTLELVFYAVCALLYWRGLLFNPRVLTGAVFIAAGVYGGGQVVSRFVHGFDREILHLIFTLGFMFLGALIRQCYDEPSIKIKRLCWLGAASLLVFPLLSVAVYMLKDADIGYLRFGAAYPLAFALFLVGLYVIRLRNSFFVWLGAISYSVYLFHPLAILLVKWVLKQPWAKDLGGGHISIYMAAVVLVTIVISACVYRWVEFPAITLGKKLSHRTSRSKKVACTYTT